MKEEETVFKKSTVLCRHMQANLCDVTIAQIRILQYSRFILSFYCVDDKEETRSFCVSAVVVLPWSCYVKSEKHLSLVQTKKEFLFFER